jgi:hypothetical protein
MVILETRRQRATMIRRLSYSIPRGPLLRQVACGLVMGKAQFTIANLVVPRLTELDGLQQGLHDAQVAVNNVARTPTGSKRGDHIRITDLLKTAGLQAIHGHGSTFRGGGGGGGSKI